MEVEFEIIKESEDTYRVVQKQPTQENSEPIQPKQPYVAPKTKVERIVTDAEKVAIKEETKAIREEFSAIEEDLTKSVRGLGLNDRSFFTYRVKSESGLNDKMEKLLKEN